jgi:hypothetical protein
MEEMFVGAFLGAILATLICLIAIQPWNPGSDMECNPGYHAVQTSDANHHRWYDCQPITP